MICGAVFALMVAVGAAQAQTNAVTTIFANTNAIPIGAFTNIGPLTMQVTSNGTIQKVTVSLFGFTYPSPSDFEGIMVAGPDTNAPIAGPDTNSIGVDLMSDAGGSFPITDVNLTFDDAATAQLPADSQIISGTYSESIYSASDFYPQPAPLVYTNVLTNFVGMQMRGNWGLYIGNLGISEGSISGGWALTITYVPESNPPPPTVTITSPANNASFTAPANIPITATASSSGGTISSVQFLANGAAIATSTSAPYAATASNLAVGTYTISAIATDDYGSTATNAVQVTVQSAPPPSVTITSPGNNASFTAPANIPITATAASSSGTILSVQFLANGAAIATSTNAPYTATASNLAAGSYTLSAIATDNSGLTATNSVQVTVKSVSSSTNLVLSSATNLPNGQIQFTVTGSPGTQFEIQSSADLSTWNVVTNVTMPAGGSYTFNGPSASAHLFYRAATTGTGPLPPTVSITSPANGASFAAPANIPITATASSSGGTISTVQFLANGAAIAASTNAPYTATASNLAAGSYTLSAIATDNSGLTATNSVQVTVKSASSSTNLVLSSPTNLPNGQIQFTVAGSPGTQFSIQSSADLSTWTVVTNVTMPAGGSYTFTGPGASAHLFYRAAETGSGPVTGGPTLSAPAVVNGHFQFTLTGQTGTNYWIESSTNLQTWTVIATNTAVSGAINFTDPAPVAGDRYYQAVVAH